MDWWIICLGLRMVFRTVVALWWAERPLDPRPAIGPVAGDGMGLLPIFSAVRSVWVADGRSPWVWSRRLRWARVAHCAQSGRCRERSLVVASGLGWCGRGSCCQVSGVGHAVAMTLRGLLVGWLRRAYGDGSLVHARVTPPQRWAAPTAASQAGRWSARQAGQCWVFMLGLRVVGCRWGRILASRRSGRQLRAARGRGCRIVR